MGWQATEETLEVREGIDVLLPTGPYHRPNANRQLRCALRSDDTDVPCGVTSGPLAAGSALMLPRLVGF